MGGDIVLGLLPEIITAVIAVLIYWIKRSIDKGIDDVKTSLTNINNNISNINIPITINSAYHVSERITENLEQKSEQIEDEP